MEPDGIDLITGGAGFLGSHLADRLLAEGRHVVVVDNLDTGLRRNCPEAADGLVFLHADTRETSWWERLPEGGIARIFHYAANASVPRSSADPAFDLTTNVLGTQNMLSLAARTGAQFVYISSAAVYGNPEVVPTDERHPTRPISFYGTSKLAGETYVDFFRREHGVDTRTIRYFNCYGPRQPRYILFDFLTKAFSPDADFRVLGTGEQVRTQLHVKDAVTATLLVASRGDASPYNVGSDTSLSVLSLASEVLRVAGREDKRIVTTGASWAGDIYTLIPDISRLTSLGFAPSVDLSEGLSDMLRWWTADDG